LAASGKTQPPDADIMCQGDDPNCHAFAEHRRRFKRDLEPERRAFLKSGFAATGAAAAAFAAGGPSLVSPALAQASSASNRRSRSARVTSSPSRR